jgi:hypothetical protein
MITLSTIGADARCGKSIVGRFADLAAAEKHVRDEVATNGAEVILFDLDEEFGAFDALVKNRGGQVVQWCAD